MTTSFESYGLSPSQAIKLFFNQVVVTHKIPLNFEYQQQENNLTAQAEMRLKQSAQEIENGEYTDYHSVDELFRLTNSFKKDLRKHHVALVSKEWIEIFSCLLNNTPIPRKYKDHALTGN